MTSTPKGLNHFYKFWTEAEAGVNDFVPYKVMWDQRPGRDEEWKRKTIQEFGEEQFLVEHCCQFLGSTDTLIDSSKLKEMEAKKDDDHDDGYKKVEMTDVKANTDNTDDDAENVEEEDAPKIVNPYSDWRVVMVGGVATFLNSFAFAGIAVLIPLWLTQLHSLCFPT